MPAESKAQQRFFGYLKANPEEAQRRGISPTVADEFAHGPGGTTKGLPQHVHKRQAGARDDTDPDLALAQAGANIFQGGLGSPQAWGSMLKSMGPAPPRPVSWGPNMLPQEAPADQAGARWGRQVGQASDSASGFVPRQTIPGSTWDPSSQQWIMPTQPQMSPGDQPLRPVQGPDGRTRWISGGQAGARGGKGRGKMHRLMIIRAVSRPLRQAGEASDAMPSQSQIGARDPDDGYSVLRLYL